MCSVVGCESSRRGAPRFPLPEDPERRLQWVQFLLEVNGMQLKESSWTDIAVCSEHFPGESFVGAGQLSPAAVPSVSIKQEPEEAAWSPGDTGVAANSIEDVKPVEISLYCPAETKPTFNKDVSSRAVQTEQEAQPKDVNENIAALLETKGKFVVNERCLLELLGRSCPSCGSKLQLEKVSCDVVLVLKRRCLKCGYKSQWQNLPGAGIPKPEVRSPTEETTSDDQQASSTAGESAVVSEIVTFTDEESIPSDDGKEADEEEEWSPTDDLLSEELSVDSEEERKDESGLDSDLGDDDRNARELCTECGKFFTKLSSHECVHKTKPFACDACGKRFACEQSVKRHRVIHNDTYKHPCKYCCVSFKTRMEKLDHEKTHRGEKSPYKCPHCSQAFPTYKRRTAHLSSHRERSEYTCRVCGLVFLNAYGLERHAVIHTGLKPHKCQVCERGFKQLTHLQCHMRLHTGEKPFECPHCDKSYHHKVSLKAHVERYHAAGSGRKRGGREGEGNSKTNSDVESEGVKEARDLEASDQPKKRKTRSTGRPVGRPKKKSCSVQAGEPVAGGPSSKRVKAKAKRTMESDSSDEESDYKQWGSNSSSESEEEEEKKKGKTKRPKEDSDSDFNPSEEDVKRKRCKKKLCKASARRRGTPK